jgi:DNA-directed RNA polymerase delta subunit
MSEKENAPTQYDAVLADLHAKRDEIESAINTILFLQGSGSAVTSTANANGAVRATRAGAIPSNAFFGMSLVDAAKKYIELSQAKRTLAQIVKGLEEGGMPPQKRDTVYAALRRRESTVGDVMRVGEEWGLKDWFAGISVGEAAKTKTTKSKKGKKKTKKATKAVASRPTKTEPTDIPMTAPEKTSTKDNASDITVRDAAHAVLVKEDAPMHAGTLAERINKGYGKTTNLKALAASLKDDGQQRFENIGHNTWVLHDWSAEKKKPRPVAVAATA